MTDSAEPTHRGSLPPVTPPGHTPTSFRTARFRDDSTSRASVGDVMPATSVELLEGSLDDAGYVSEQPDDMIGGKRKANRIQVIVRKRPLNDKEGGEDCLSCENSQVFVNATKLRVDLTAYQETYQYVFDGACPESASNDDVYNTCGRDLITTVFEGGSASCFAYGQTGSGKTHTMIGTDMEPGLYMLAASDIFARCQPHHRVFVSFYEIYCNTLYDLLNQRTVLNAREDARHRINICGLRKVPIRNVKEILRVIDRGFLQRRTGSTSANESSSRSHAIMTISLTDEQQPSFLGNLNIVDLAGSERAADTAATDKTTQKEGAAINTSLLALKECIRCLDEGKRSHIPFRGSKLTEVLRDSFVGNSRTAMIATVSPSSTNAEHTLNTLRYAFRVKGLSVDCPMPSKERNAPRPTQRSKSTDVETAATAAAARREPSLARDNTKAEKKKRGNKKRTPRHRLVVDASADIDRLVDERVAAKMEEMREEQRRTNEMIKLMAEQLSQLRAEANQLRGHPSRLPPLNDVTEVASANVHSARSERSSRRSRRKHRHEAESPTGSARRRRTKSSAENQPTD